MSIKIQATERALLGATLQRIDAERALSEACERPTAPEYGTPAYDAWRESDEAKTLGAREQRFREVVYEVHRRWEAIADDYYDAVMSASVPVLENRGSE